MSATSFPRRALAVLGLIASLAVPGCDNPGPTFVESSRVVDTDFELGPYAVRAVLDDADGMGSVRLFYSPVGRLSGVAHMDLLDDTEVAAEVSKWSNDAAYRYAGGIPGQPIGTVVNWGIEACDALGNCSTDPEGFPNEAYTFRVGTEPSDPAITRVSPDSGPASGGTRVIIDGDDFRPGVEVLFGDEPAAHVEIISDGRIAVLSPEHDVGAVTVTVVNPDDSAAEAVDAFVFEPAPIIYDILPAQGPTAGGTVVTISGENFTEGLYVTFDDVPCRDLALGDPTWLTCVTPPGGEGFADVAVLDDAGGRGVVEEGFLYIAPPRVNVVSPDRGTDLGGTVIEVEGENFDDDAVVLINGVPCDAQTVLSDELIVCTTPAGSPGLADVEVVNNDGQSGLLPGGFNFLGPPVVVQVIPGIGPVVGGIEVRIIGAGFSELMAVDFGGAPAEILDVIDDLELRVQLPPTVLPLTPAPESGLAAVDVTVTNLDPSDGRSDTLESGFTYYWPPEVFEVIPPQGPTAGGTDVTIVGRFFRELEGEDVFAYFGEETATNLQLVSSTAITATTPPGPPGFVDVTVENAPWSAGTLEDGFEYIPPPEVIAAEPAEGPTFGGERVTIVGEYFQNGALVFIDGLVCSDVTFIDAEHLECTTPGHPAGVVDITVVNPDGQDGTGEGIYEYLPVAVSPDFGLEGGFTRTRVRAAGIQQGATVRFGDQIATDCTWVSSLEIICQSPAAPEPGPVEVGFINPDGTGDSAEAAFEYRRFLDFTEGQLDGDALEATDVESVDIDLDGDLDLVVSNQDGDEDENWDPKDTHVHLNDGTGAFTRISLPEPADGMAVDVGDINDDEWPDLVVAQRIGGSNFDGAILYTNIDGQNFSATNIPAANFGQVQSAFDAQLLDLMGDGRDDLLVLAIGCSNDPDNPELCDLFESGADGLFERTGAGQFVDRSSLIPHELGYVHDHKIGATDLDDDGDLDIVLFVDNFNFGSVGNEHRILINRVNEGLGFVEDTSPFGGLVGDVFGVTTGDIDGDGIDDVVAGSCDPAFDSNEVVYLASGGTLVRSFTALPEEQTDCDYGVRIFDADNDGDNDLAFAGSRGNEFQIKMYVNRGDGTFVSSHVSVPAYDGFAQGTGIATGDFDGDGDLDMAVSATGSVFNPSGTLRLLILE